MREFRKNLPFVRKNTPMEKTCCRQSKFLLQSIHIMSELPLSMGRWHIIKISRTARLAVLKVDQLPEIMTISPNGFWHLSLPHISIQIFFCEMISKLMLFLVVIHTSEQICRQSDPNLSECLISVIHAFRPQLKTGRWTENTQEESVDPLYIDAVDFGNGDSIKLKFTDVLINGLTSFTIKSLRVDNSRQCCDHFKFDIETFKSITLFVQVRIVTINMANSESIAIIDCSKIIKGEESLKEFSEKLGAALSEIGFTYLINTGVDLKKVSKEFFDLPTDVKRKMRKPPAAASFHGYAGPGDELLNESNHNATELREFYDVTGHVESNNEAYFPPEVPGFKDAFDQARKECLQLCEIILRSISLYLGLDQDDLLKRHTHLYDRSVPTQTVMRSSMYSPLAEKVPEGAIRCGEHCDWHTITLLFQDMVGGLEVRGTNGQWIAATPIKDAILLNSGQLLEIYSGGKLPATPHRIRILNEDKLYDHPRQSLVYCPSPDGPEDVEPLVPILKELNGRVRSIYGPSSYDK
ncbi:UPF0676 protein, partial [Pseudolycoriella hygida]